MIPEDQGLGDITLLVNGEVMGEIQNIEMEIDREVIPENPKGFQVGERYSGSISISKAELGFGFMSPRMRMFFKSICICGKLYI